MLLKKSSKIIQKRFNPLAFRNRYYFMQPPRYDSNKDYYKILGVSKQASEAQLKKEYYKLAKKYHPDHNKGSQSKFKEISQAYQVLSDKNLKAQYDQSRVFGSFTQKLGRKVKQGDYKYNSYKEAFQQQYTQEQHKMIRQQFIKLVKKIAMFGIGFVLFSMIFLRSPNHFYQQVGGRLIPVDPKQVAALNYNIQQPPLNYSNQGGSPHGIPYGGGYPQGGAFYGGAYQQGGAPYGGGQAYNAYPSNQGYQGYTQVTANPYTPPNSNYYNPSQNSNFQRNNGDNIYNPRMQSNYINRSGSPPDSL